MRYTAEQDEYYGLLTEIAEGAKCSLPVDATREDAADIIQDVLNDNPRLMGKSVDQLRAMVN